MGCEVPVAGQASGGVQGCACSCALTEVALGSVCSVSLLQNCSLPTASHKNRSN